MSDEVKCGMCDLPIHRNESGVRHFGFYTAHSEARCRDLLRLRAQTAEAERDEWMRRAGGSLAGRDYHIGNASEFHAALSMIATAEGSTPELCDWMRELATAVLATGECPDARRAALEQGS